MAEWKKLIISDVRCLTPLQVASNKNAEAFLKIGEVRTKMGMFDPKKRKIITAVIAVILVLAIVVPSVLSILF